MTIGTHSGIAAAVVVAMLAAAPAAVAMTPAAEAIFARVKATNQINTICRDMGSVRTAVTKATRDLLRENVLSGSPRPDAQAAGRHILENCGRL